MWEELVTQFTVEEEPAVEREVKTVQHTLSLLPKTQTNKIPKQNSPAWNVIREMSKKSSM